MKLERIHVERYGAWNNLELPVDADGMSVYYGPNEAGKTTLMRFIRGVLYGFRRGDTDRIPGRVESGSWGGSLQVAHGTESWVVRRTGKTGTRGLVTARPADGDFGASASDGRTLLGDIVGDVNETVFESIFAIGLYELQELATLESREVAEHIYSLSLGLDGQQLLELIDGVRDASQAILNVEAETGRLTELYEELDEVDSEIASIGPTRKRHAKLSHEQEKWEDTIVDLKQRQQGLENQLHGHEYLERVYDPWAKLHRHEQELALLPNLPDFPEDGLQSLEEIETELAAARGRRNALLTESKQLRAKSKEANVDPNFRRYAPALQSFVDQRDWIAELQAASHQTDLKAEELQRQLDAHLEDLGEGWDAEKLQRIDTSHLGRSCLTHRGREFQTLGRRSRVLKNRYQKLSLTFHRRQEELQRLRKQLGGVSIVEAISRAREELAQVEDLSRLKLRESELNQRRIGIANQLHRLQINPALPDWVYAIFYAFGITGSVLCLFGLWTGLTANALGGFVYLLAGLLAGGMTYALKEHFEQEVERTMSQLRGELRELGLRIVETGDAIARVAPVIMTLRTCSQLDEMREEPNSTADSLAETLASESAEMEDDEEEDDLPLLDPIPETSAITTRWIESSNQIVTIAPEPDGTDAEVDDTPEPKHPGAQSVRTQPPAPPAVTEADLLRRSLARMSDLEEMVRVETWVEQTRAELIAMRAQLKDAQCDFGVARQSWCSHLVEQGLDETLVVDEALGQRDLVARAGLVLSRLTAIQEDAHVARRMCEQFRKRVEEFGHRLQQWEADYSNPVPVLDRWSQALAQFAQIRRQERQLRREAKKRRAEAGKYRSQIRKLESKQAAILVRGGSVSREDFEQRAELLERRFEIQELVDRARQELEAVASTERTMAIVESDLEQYDSEQNRMAIDTIRQELDDLSLDVEEAFEKLGRIKEELHALENDRRPAELRFEREQIVSQIRDLAEEWFALEWSARTLDELRFEFEKSHQPPILNRAKEYLNRLSGGRYTNIWTPLGQRTLCVDDTDGNTLMVEYLSGGTREQLFLAIRLALIEHFSSQGVELPVVLDDILVNFDHERTQAALGELLRHTSENQQILFFTCHKHLAEMFRQRGVSTVRLPDRRALADGKLAG
ncbi:MAG: AAA family ATPase [Planctomycetota bacterium]|nr:AAA family ATPase [Planctomycetota bacterium]MDA1250356.1 AAA family ATPase [Planctomycetota bacterium]